MVLVGVTVFVAHVVDATEEEGLVTDRQLIQAVQRGAHDDVAFDEVAGAAHVRHRRAVAQRSRLVAHVVERYQGTIEERLFLCDLTLVRHIDLSSGPEMGFDKSRGPWTPPVRVGATTRSSRL